MSFNLKDESSKFMCTFMYCMRLGKDLRMYTYVLAL